MSAADDDGTNGLIVVLDPIHVAGLTRLGERFDVDFCPAMPADHDRQGMLHRAVALVVRTFPATPGVMDSAPCLQLIVKHGAGVDNIDISAATARGICVVNTPGGASSAAVAEGAVALMLATLRRVPEMDRAVREGRFADRWTSTLGDLTGRRLGLVGFGRIARHVAEICRRGFGMEVAAFDPFVPPATMHARQITPHTNLEALAARSDVLSVHVPLGEATRGIIDANVLAALPRHAIVVNTSRGGIVDEAALAAALSDKRIWGAGLDVFETEPPDPCDPLLSLPNVVAAPHVAGVTEQSLRDMSLDVASALAAFFDGNRPETLLNPAAWPPARVRAGPRANQGDGS